jgi:8-oxo-dGTP pyrophosphatase MutT (NUDIX family)
MSTDAPLLVRPAARVILADSRDRILLLRCEDSTIDVPVLWLTPGGACEAGESSDEAAIRELWEESGIRALKLGPLVWRRRHVWRWGERMIDTREDYFFLRCDEVPSIAPAAQSDFELTVIRELRWWSLTELQQSPNEVFVPRRFAELVAPLLKGVFPAEPLEVGT